MSPKRILIFSLAYYPVIGGAEVAIKEITDRITDIEFDLITLSLSKEGKRFERVGNVNVHRIGGGLGYLSKILFVPRAALYALNLLRANQYDSLWAMMTYMLFPITLMRILGNRTPYILTLQDGDPFIHVFNRWRISLFKPLLIYGFRHASQVQVISNFLAEWAMALGSRNDVKVIPNGVDLRRFMNNESRIMNKEKINLITTSRLVQKNGIKDLIESLKYLPENICLKILGTGPLESELKNYSIILNLESRIRFLGFVPQDEIPKYLSEADVFIRPSLSEGQGISFLEAMAVGLPVIATRVGGIPDFLIDEETGLFCEVHNPESIAKQVEKLCNDSYLRRKIIDNGQRLVRERYDWNLIAGEIKDRVFDKV